MSNASVWWDRLEPYAVPLAKWMAPLALRAILWWWARAQRERQLTRRRRVQAWAVAFAAKARIDAERSESFHNWRAAQKGP